jgi:hypothetical protein
MPDRSESSTITVSNNTRQRLTLKSALAEKIEGYWQDYPAETIEAGGYMLRQMLNSLGWASVNMHKQPFLSLLVHLFVWARRQGRRDFPHVFFVQENMVISSFPVNSDTSIQVNRWTPFNMTGKHEYRDP